MTAPTCLNVFSAHVHMAFKGIETEILEPAGCPISRLVDDILCLIFDWCSLRISWYPTEYPFFKPKEMLNICAVCRSWNDIARDHAILWTHIHLEKAELALLQFRLSRDAPLQLIYGADCNFCRCSRYGVALPQQTLEAIEENIHRTEVLDFCQFNQAKEKLHMERLLRALFSQPAPLLKVWSMRCPGFQYGSPLVNGWYYLSYPFQGQLPNIRRVFCLDYMPHNYFVLFQSSTRIQYFIASENSSSSYGLQAGRPPFDLASILLSNVELKRISIPSVGTFSSQKTPTITMESLTALRIGTIAHANASAFFNQVYLPAIMDVDLSIRADINTSWPVSFSFFNFLKERNHLERLLNSLVSLRLRKGLPTIECMGLAHQRLRIMLLDGAELQVFTNILNLFPNVTSINANFPLMLLDRVDIGPSNQIDELEVHYRAYCANFFLTVRPMSTFPALSRIRLLLLPIRPNDADWWRMFELLRNAARGVPTITIVWYRDSISLEQLQLSEKLTQEMESNGIQLVFEKFRRWDL